MLAFQICDPAPRRFPTGRNWRGSSNRKLRPPISGRFVTDEFAAKIEDPNICRPLERKNSQSDTVHVFAWKSSMEEERHPFSRSEEHTSELQSLMRISYAVLCL